MVVTKLLFIAVGFQAISFAQGILGHCCYEKVVKELQTTVLMNQVFISKQFELIIGLLGEDPYTASLETEPKPDLAARCVAPYTFVDGRCFFVAKMNRNWQRARQTCKNMKGGHLARMDDAFRKFIVAQTKGSDAYWIAGRKGRGFLGRRNKRECPYVNTSKAGMTEEDVCSRGKKFVCQIE